MNKAKDPFISLENPFKDLSLNKIQDVLECDKPLKDDVKKEIEKKTITFSKRKTYVMHEDIPSIFDLFHTSSSSDNVRYAGSSSLING